MSDFFQGVPVGGRGTTTHASASERSETARSVCGVPVITAGEPFDPEAPKMCSRCAQVVRVTRRAASSHIEQSRIEGERYLAQALRLLLDAGLTQHDVDQLVRATQAYQAMSRGKRAAA